MSTLSIVRSSDSKTLSEHTRSDQKESGGLSTQYGRLHPSSSPHYRPTQLTNKQSNRRPWNAHSCGQALHNLFFNCVLIWMFGKKRTEKWPSIKNWTHILIRFRLPNLLVEWPIMAIEGELTFGCRIFWLEISKPMMLKRKPSSSNLDLMNLILEDSQRIASRANRLFTVEQLNPCFRSASPCRGREPSQN